MYSEKELLEGCRKNNRKYQQALYSQYAPRMFAVCLRYADDRMQAEDFLQEGFVKVFTRLDQFSGEGSFEGWIRRIMVNTALQQLRREKNFPVIVDEEHAQYETQESNALDNMAADELMRLIQKLPPGYRMVFNLYVLEEYTHKEIACELGVTEGTSKSQLARARAILQKMIRQNESVQDKPVRAELR